MIPYYSHAGITIYHGDCREILPQLERPTVMITDPVWPNCPAGLLQGSDAPQALFGEMLAAKRLSQEVLDLAYGEHRAGCSKAAVP
jgi:hypothetical protein